MMSLSCSESPTPCVCLCMHFCFKKSLLIITGTTFPGFPSGSNGKESASNAGDLDSIPEWGRFPGVENGFPLQYYYLENSMDRGVWWATVHGLQSQTRLSDKHPPTYIHTHTHTHTHTHAHTHTPPFHLRQDPKFTFRTNKHGNSTPSYLRGRQSNLPTMTWILLYC